MNGTHDNWDLQKTKRGATLRDRARFCFWCEELLVARVCEKTIDADWKKWETELRPLYQKAYDVAARIQAQNEADAKAGLAGAKIFERP